jgi:hypothetical protein
VPVAVVFVVAVLFVVAVVLVAAVLFVVAVLFVAVVFLSIKKGTPTEAAAVIKSAMLKLELSATS